MPYDRRIMLAQFTATYSRDGRGESVRTVERTRWEPMWATAGELGTTADQITLDPNFEPDLQDVQERTLEVRYLEPADWPNLTAAGSTERTEDGAVNHYSGVYDEYGRLWDVTAIYDGEDRKRATTLTVQRSGPYVRGQADIDPSEFPESY